MLFVVVMWLFGAVGDGYVMVCYVWWLSSASLLIVGVLCCVC